MIHVSAYKPASAVVALQKHAQAHGALFSILVLCFFFCSPCLLSFFKRQAKRSSNQVANLSLLLLLLQPRFLPLLCLPDTILTAPA